MTCYFFKYKFLFNFFFHVRKSKMLNLKTGVPRLLHRIVSLTFILIMNSDKLLEAKGSRHDITIIWLQSNTESCAWNCSEQKIQIKVLVLARKNLNEITDRNFCMSLLTVCYFSALEYTEHSVYHECAFLMLVNFKNSLFLK